MTRRTPDGDTGALVEEILDERLEAFEDWRDALGEDPSAEPVHEVRVAARRLLAALGVFRPLLDLPEEVDSTVLREVERRLGKLRDLDVLASRISEASVSGEAVVARLEATIAVARNEALKQARAGIERKRLRRLTSGLRAWLEEPTCTAVAALPLALLAPDLLFPVLSPTLLHPGWLVADVPAPDIKAAAPLHGLRRQVKVLRYAVECLEECYGEPVEEWLNELHAIQDALGAWHDEGLLLEWLRETEGTAELRAESLARAHAAMALWPVWRARYLDPETRLGLRLLVGGGAPTVRDAIPPAGAPAAVYLPPPRPSPIPAVPDPRPTA